MKTKAGLLVVALLLVSTGNAQDAKKELARFAGKWNVEELTYNGKDHSKLKISVDFKGDVGVIEGSAEVKREYARIKFKLDPAATPKILDITVAGGSQEDAKMEGIYEFKGDELRLCVKVFGNERPTKFESPDGGSTVLMVLKRVTP